MLSLVHKQKVHEKVLKSRLLFKKWQTSQLNDYKVTNSLNDKFKGCILCI